MSEWIQPLNSYPRLGREGTPDYRGYVVNVQGTEDGHPEQWFTYAYDQEGEFHYWIGMTGSEEEAKALLDRLLSEGWKCEIYDSHAGHHCREQAVMVRHLWYRNKRKPMGERLRVLLCEGHGETHPGWKRMTIREYADKYNELEQDAPILGPRIP
jgi:hypothetical protein